jgi:hypothetical protein
VQAVGGAATAIAGVIGTPETGGVSLLAVSGGAANLTLGSAAVLDGGKLVYAAFTGSGNVQSTFGQIGQQYGGETGSRLGELANIAGQVISAATSPAETADAAVANAAMSGLSNTLPNAGTICGN